MTSLVTNASALIALQTLRSMNSDLAADNAALGLGAITASAGSTTSHLQSQTSVTTSLLDANTAATGPRVDAGLGDDSTNLAALQTQQQLAVQSLNVTSNVTLNTLSAFQGQAEDGTAAVSSETAPDITSTQQAEALVARSEFALEVATSASLLIEELTSQDSGSVDIRSLQEFKSNELGRISDLDLALTTLLLSNTSNSTPTMDTTTASVPVSGVTATRWTEEEALG